MAEGSTSVSVVIPTHNHASDLARTLTAFLDLDCSNIDVEFVIVNNNSTDDTAQVLKRHTAHLNLRVLFEERPGKNAALNHALRAVDLSELVVFTDDDVLPRPDWLQQIVDISRRWPDYDVFGGKCYVVWPCDEVPQWALSDEILRWGFSSNEDIGDTEAPYPPKRYPVGINYWVRSSVLVEGVRFDEAIGPIPKNRIMGDETKFQMLLASRGHKILYSHRAVVGHCVQPAMVTPSGIRRRAFYIGRTGPNLNGPSQPELLRRRPWLWRLRRRTSLARYAILYAWSWLTPTADQRVEKSVAAIRGLAANWEMLRLESIRHPLYSPQPRDALGT